MLETQRSISHGSRRVRFASFEVNFAQRELRRSGVRVPLQHKPFRILELLLREPGSLVTREELAKHLWPDLHVSFSRSLNTAVNALRQALGESSRECQFIETRSGLGYRFVAPVEEIREAAEPSDSDGRQDCLMGRHFLGKMTGEALQRAIGCFQAALSEDDGCAAAWAGLAETYCRLAMLGTAPPADVGEKAREFAARALSGDGRLAEAHVAAGRVKTVFDWDWKGARGDYALAKSLNPDLADAHASLALLVSALGEHEEALRESRRALMLDPLSAPIGGDLAWIQYVGRDFHEAAEQCWKVLSLEPRFSQAQSTLGLAYEQLGWHQEAITEAENACVCSDRHPAALSALGSVYAGAGMKEQAYEVLRELDERARVSYVSPCWRGVVYAGLGEHQPAMEALQMAKEQRDPMLLWMNVDPRFDELRMETGYRFQFR